MPEAPRGRTIAAEGHSDSAILLHFVTQGRAKDEVELGVEVRWGCAGKQCSEYLFQRNALDVINDDVALRGGDGVLRQQVKGYAHS